MNRERTNETIAALMGGLLGMTGLTTALAFLALQQGETPEPRVIPTRPVRSRERQAYDQMIHEENGLGREESGPPGFHLQDLIDGIPGADGPPPTGDGPIWDNRPEEAPPESSEIEWTPKHKAAIEREGRRRE